MQNYFDNIYIINLPHRTDRKKEIEDQFSKIGLGIDGEYIRLFSAFRPDASVGFPTIGARGCFMSHLAVLTHARDRSLGNILIIEDDCNFVSRFLEKLLAIQTDLPRNSWSFFYGGALNVVDSTQDQNPWLTPNQALAGSHFIAVNGAVLADLVAYFETMLTRPPGDPLGGPMHVDGAYSWFRASHPECITYLATPELAYQRSSATDIHQRKWFERLSTMQWIFGRLRKVKNIVFNSKR